MTSTSHSSSQLMSLVLVPVAGISFSVPVFGAHPARPRAARVPAIALPEMNVRREMPALAFVCMSSMGSSSFGFVLRRPFRIRHRQHRSRAAPAHPTSGGK